MGRKGNKKSMKRITVPNRIPITNKKQYTFIDKVSPGPHSKQYSVPLSVLLRDILSLASSMKEVKKALSMNKIKVDGKTRKKADFPVGLMDVLQISDKTYRMLLDEKGKFKLYEISQNETLKPLKIIKKTPYKKSFQLTFHDGTTYLTKDNSYKVGDVVLFDLTKKNIVSLVKNKEGVNCIVIKGRHAGLRGTVKQIVEKGRAKEVVVSSKDREVITYLDYIFPLPEGW